jgi:hypothetical protein
MIQAPASTPEAAPGSAKPAREISEQDKALSRSLQKEIEAGLKDRDGDFKRFAHNRQLLRGIDPETGQKMRTNLHFGNLAAMRPQVYAKDPEFTVQPTRGVTDQRMPAVRAFGETAEAVLEKLLIGDAKLKRRAKRLLTSCYTNAIGWWKLSWQQGRPADPLITNRIKDTQDNLALIEQQKAALESPHAGNDADLKEAELRETLAGLQVQAEKRIGRGLALDFVMPEDMLVLDRGIFEIQDYERAGKLAHGVWMTRGAFEREFGYDPEKARVYRDKSDANTSGQTQANGQDKDRDSQLLRVWEVWDQHSNRVHTVCIGDEGLCRESYSPDWCGQRWYPFFLLVWNEVDGCFMPPSDIDLTHELVKEYNETRQALAKDRDDSRPFTVVRKGGSLTPQDVESIRNRKGNDIIAVEGVGGQAISADIQSVQLGQIDPNTYDTTQARSDLEMLLGGGDAARGSVLKAKTATEAEILSQGLRGRSAERTDVIEDLLSEVGAYALEVCLRKLTPDEVARIAGEAAVWPQLTAEEVFEQVTVRVRGGSTGKPDRLQEQDRWTKLLPVIKDTVKEIVATRQAGQEQLAQMAIALLKETLRRFDERFEIERYLPEPAAGKPGQDGQPEQPQVTPEMVQQAQELVQQLQAKVQGLEGALADKSAADALAQQKAQLEADAKVRIAAVTAPIEAQAQAEVARIRAEATAAVDMRRAELDAMAGADARAVEAQGLEAVNQTVAQLQAGQEQLAQMLAAMAQASAQPKPRMKVQHLAGPDGAIVESRLVPDEPEQERED